LGGFSGAFLDTYLEAVMSGSDSSATCESSFANANAKPAAIEMEAFVTEGGMTLFHNS
jgi:hypothetical protein